jgi:hypothetical protein
MDATAIVVKQVACFVTEETVREFVADVATLTMRVMSVVVHDRQSSARVH